MTNEARSDNGIVDARGRARVQTVNTQKSMTRQSDAKNSDINFILKKYDLGLAQHLRDVDAVYLDVSEHTDYADMARMVKDAEMQFTQLPAKVREVFNNDVHQWLDAAHATEGEKNALLAKAGVEGFTLPGESIGAPDLPTPVQTGEPTPTPEVGGPE